jgi:hypothetical protein
MRLFVCSVRLLAIIVLCGATVAATAGSALGGEVVQALPFTASPSTLSFGIPTGSNPAVSAPQTITVTVNTGAVTFATPPTPPFAVSSGSPFSVTGDSCSGTITAPATCQIIVTFSSSLTTLSSDTLNIAATSGTSNYNLAVPLTGAYGAIKVFSSTTVSVSNPSASYTNPYTINTQPLNLSCPAVPGAAVTATLSSTPDGSGNVLVDNFITLNVNGAFVGTGSPAGNVCAGGVTDIFDGSTQVSCFTSAYQDAAENGQITGTNTDYLTQSVPNGEGPGGVAPLNLTPFFTLNEDTPYSLQTTITMLDAGGYQASSSLFLVTTCGDAGITPGGSVTGNPITQGNTSSQTQTLVFDGAPGDVVEFTISDAVAIDQGSTVNNVTPVVTDYAISQTQFAQLVAGTSAAPAVCLRLTAELGSPDASGQPYMCKGYQVQCYNPADGTTSGNNCGSSMARNLFNSAQFDSPDTPVPATVQNTFSTSCAHYLSLLSITGGTCVAPSAPGPNPTTLIGPGFLMFGDSSNGPVCPLIAPLSTGLCPLDTLTEIKPAADNQPGGSAAPIRNSIFVPVVNMPKPFTNNVSVSGPAGGPSSTNWVSSGQVTANFTSNAATYSPSNTNPPVNGFTAAAPYSLTFGFAASSQPIPDTTYPVAGDVTNYNQFTNPAFAAPFCNNGGTTPSSFASNSGISLFNLLDGIYNLHYFTTDCALTEELLFNPAPNQVNDPTANWASFQVLQFGVDTVAPTLSCSFSPSPANGSNGWYTSAVTESCTAKDNDYVAGTTGSGFLPLTNGVQGSMQETLTPAALSATGAFPTQTAQDLAGNASNQVVSPTFYIDETSPVISCKYTTSASCGSDPTFTVGQTVSANFSCSDAISGISTCAGTPATSCGTAPAAGPSSFATSSAISTAVGQVGTHSLTVTTTDCAGNSSSTTESYTVAYAAATVAFGQFPLMIAVQGTNLEYLVGAADTNPATNPISVYGADISLTLTIPSGTLATGTASAIIADVSCTSFPCSAVPPSGSSCSVSPSSVSSSTTSITVNCTAGTIADIFTNKTGVVMKVQLPISAKASIGKSITTSGTMTAASPISGTTTFKSTVPIL